MQRLTMPIDDGQIPSVSDGSQGVRVQRREVPLGDGQIPLVKSDIGGQGVSSQRTMPSGQIPKMTPTPGTVGHTIARGARLRPWLHELAARLKGVIVLNRSWQSSVTPSVLAQTDSGTHPPVGILLDPPYLTEGRDASVYGSDADGSSDAVSAESWAWAQAHGDRYRIAYCCHEGDVTVPDVWTSETQSFTGIRSEKRREQRRDQILFSPACLPDDQPSLF